MNYLTRSELKATYDRNEKWLKASERESYRDYANKVLAIFDSLPDANGYALYYVLDFPSPTREVEPFYLYQETPTEVKIELLSFIVHPSSNGREWKVEI